MESDEIEFAHIPAADLTSENGKDRVFSYIYIAGNETVRTGRWHVKHFRDLSDLEEPYLSGLLKLREHRAECMATAHVPCRFEEGPRGYPETSTWELPDCIGGVSKEWWPVPRHP